MKVNNNLIEKVIKHNFISEIIKAGGEIFFVGGIVRDSILKKESKDVDILIRLLEIDKLIVILNRFGKVDQVGKSFGVLKFIPTGMELGEPIDIALPRTEKKVGTKHTDFEINSNPFLSLEDDLFRRDFTFNSMALDINMNLFDPFNGMEDISNKRIRLTNPDAFSEDPLRMLRAVQFASRFGFNIESNTLENIMTNRDNILDITGERILIELEKIFFKGDIKHGLNLLNNTKLIRHINSNIDVGLADKIKTLSDFFCVITNFNSLKFETQLKGNNKTALEMDIINTMLNKPKLRLSGRLLVFKNNQKSLNAFTSGLINPKFRTILDEMNANNNLPLSFKDVNINGTDLMKLGLKGKDIGNTLKIIVDFLLGEVVNNNKEDILKSIT